MDEVHNLTKEQAQEWLRNLGLAVSGTKEELINRIKKYIRYPNLVQRLKGRANHNYAFACSLDPLIIPPHTARWDANISILPKISQDIFLKYAS